ncbi:hypothetical protein [Methylopila sp. 73B]|uniref:hypothetical protein n=1 Tax=Methylopila sp. 73B TaxID=1120792 RepID=UPI00037C3DC7|nr:hypothetical protein [Methylopila sp. 73B]
MKISSVKALGQKIEKGAWVRTLPGMEDLQLKVRARFNTDYLHRQEELVAAEEPANKPDGVLTKEAARRHDAILLADTVLVDWANLTDDDKNPVPYSREVAEELLLDPDEPAFRNAVNYAAMVVADQGELDLKAAAGN